MLTVKISLRKPSMDIRTISNKYNKYLAMCRKDNPETFFVNIPFLQVMFQILFELRLEETSYFLECLA